VLQGLRGLNKLSTQLLVLAQTSSEQPIKNLSAIRIDDILWEIKDELNRLHPEYAVDIDLSMDVNHEALLVEGDEQLLKVAIMNLMDNGCKYADDHRVTINVHRHFTRSVVIDFVNNGPGIPTELMERIFDPFFRANASKKIKGFGIGLSLVKRILILHGGKISVESIPDIKTCFSVTLPTVGVKAL